MDLNPNLALWEQSIQTTNSNPQHPLWTSHSTTLSAISDQHQFTHTLKINLTIKNIVSSTKTMLNKSNCKDKSPCMAQILDLICLNILNSKNIQIMQASIMRHTKLGPTFTKQEEEELSLSSIKDSLRLETSTQTRINQWSQSQLCFVRRKWKKEMRKIGLKSKEVGFHQEIKV